jgi:hypothetical protein
MGGNSESYSKSIAIDPNDPNDTNTESTVIDADGDVATIAAKKDDRSDNAI